MHDSSHPAGPQPDGSQIHVHQPHGPSPDVPELPVVGAPGNQDDVPAAYFRFKPAVDFVITASLMICALPLMLVVGLAVLVCDGRPVFFRQVRVGRGGRQFRIWKFRTMQRDAEQQTGPVWSSAADPRVTRLGRWLRCSHLDELPQFLNVLSGDMNLVGPRPERPEFVRRLTGHLPDYHKRTLVRPGITGYAQLHLGYDRSLAGIPEKVAFDLHYIQSASFFGDIILLALTLPHIAKELYLRWMNQGRGKTVDKTIPQPNLTRPPAGKRARKTRRRTEDTSYKDRVA